MQVRYPVALGTESLAWSASSQGHMETPVHSLKDTRDMSCIHRTKMEGCDFAFYTFDIFLGSWKRRYFSTDLQRDFSLVWVRAGRSAVGQHGLCSRLLLFSAVLSHLHSHTELIFACSRSLHSQNMLLTQNKQVWSLETESLSRLWGKEWSKETWDATGKQKGQRGGQLHHS